MSRLNAVVEDVLAGGERSLEEVVAECRQRGLTCRAETVEVFLRLAREVEERNQRWGLRGRSARQRLVAALDKVFAGAGAYVSVERLAQHLDQDTPVALEDIAAACAEGGRYRLVGKLIVRG
jgi:hypothetical protein